MGDRRPDQVDRRVAEDIAVPTQDPPPRDKKDVIELKDKLPNGKDESKDDEMVCTNLS